MKQTVGKRILSVILVITMVFVSLCIPTASVMATANDITVLDESSAVDSSYVGTVNGNTAIMVKYEDGTIKPLTDVSFKTYAHTSAREDYIYQMAQNGTKNFTFVVTLADSGIQMTSPVWTGYDKDGNRTYNFELIDERMRRVLKSCPDAIVTPQIIVGVPLTWLETNRETAAAKTKRISTGDVSWFYDDNAHSESNRYYPAIASSVFREEAGDALEDVIAYCEREYGQHVVGYNINGMATEEWYHHGWHNDTQDDYSNASISGFQSWLEEKYTTDGNLRAAWGETGSFGFNDVVIPTPAERFRGANQASSDQFYDTATDMNVVDFHRYNNEIIPDTILYFTQRSKNIAPNKITGAFYAYQYENGGDIGAGMNALEKLISGSSIDQILVTASYQNRYPGTGADSLRAPLKSAQLNGKVVHIDNDIVTSEFLNTDAFYNVSGPELDSQLYEVTNKYAYSADPNVSASVIRRAFGAAMSNGFLTNFFDLHGGYYNNSTILSEVQKLDKAFVQSYQLDRSSAAEILVVTDEASCEYLKQTDMNGNPFLNSELKLMIKNFAKIGAPFDAVLVNDLDKINLEQYKMIYVANSYNATNAQRTKLDLLKGGNRTVVWCYAPGLFNEGTRSISGISSLTGITVAQDTTRRLGLRFQVLGASSTLKTNIRTESGVSVVSNLNISSGFDMPNFTVNDSSAVTVAVNPDSTDKVTMAVKAMSGWTSVYSSFANLPSYALRAIAKTAGVHLYTAKGSGSDQNLWYDTVTANKNLVTVHANGTKSRTVTFPAAKDVYDFITGAKLATNTASVTINMLDTETRILRIENPGYERIFEEYTTHVPVYPEPDISDAHSGTHSLAITKGAPWAKAHYSYLSLEEGERYRFSFWAKAPDAANRNDIKISANLTYSTENGAPDLDKPPVDLVGEDLYYVMPVMSLAVTPVEVRDDGWAKYETSTIIEPKDLTGGLHGVRHPGTSNRYGLFIYTNISDNTTDGVFYIDDVEFFKADWSTGEKLGANMIINSDFESDVPISQNWSTGVAVSYSLVGPPITSSNANSGKNSMYVDKSASPWTGWEKALYQYLTFEEGKTYRVKYSARVENPKPDDAMVSQLSWHDSQNIEKYPSPTLGNAIHAVTDDLWHTYISYFTVPEEDMTLENNPAPGTDSGYGIYIYTGNQSNGPSTSSFYLDDVEIIEVNNHTDLTPVTGALNLITGSSFETGIPSNWSGIGSALSLPKFVTGQNAMFVDKTNGHWDGWEKALYQYFTLEEGKAYRIRYAARIVNPSNDAAMGTQLSWQSVPGTEEYPAPTLANAAIPVYDSAWHVYEAHLTVPEKDMALGNPAPGTDDRYGLYIYTGTRDNGPSTSSFYVDDVEIIEVNNQLELAPVDGACNLIFDPSFETGRYEGWSGVGCLLPVTTTASGSRAAYFNKTNGEWGGWEKALYRYISLEEGKAYRLRYSARISNPQPNDAMIAALSWEPTPGDEQNPSPPFANAMTPVTDGFWHNYESHFTVPTKNMTPSNPSPGTDDRYGIYIYSGSTSYGSSTSSFYLDDVEIIEVDDQYSLTPVSGAENLFPDPSFEQANITGWSGLGCVMTSVYGGDMAPVAQNSTVTTYKGIAKSGTVFATDANGQALTYKLAKRPENGTVTLSNNGSYVYTPDDSFTGTDTFTFRAYDGIVDSKSALVTVTVLNSPPEVLAVINAIAMLPDAANVFPEHQTDVANARALYSSLIDKSGVTNLSRLETAEAELIKFSAFTFQTDEELTVAGGNILLDSDSAAGEILALVSKSDAAASVIIKRSPAASEILGEYDSINTNAVLLLTYKGYTLQTLTFVRYGDVLADALISVSDIVQMKKISLGITSGLSPQQILAADLNNDTDVNAYDIVALKKYTLGISETVRSIE